MITATMAKKPKQDKPQNVDASKLVTVSKYAKMRGVERQTIYNWLKEPEKHGIKSVIIDNIVFIDLS